MSVLALTRVTGKDLLRLDIALEAGISVVHAEAPGAGAELVRLAAGLARPRRGVVRIDDRDPHASPELRARIGSLLDAESAPEGTTVAGAVGRVEELRGGSRTGRRILEDFGLAGWAERSPRGLSPDEARELALVVALTVERPALLALVEPLAAGLARERVVRALSEQAVQGAVILVVTASARDARDLAGRTLVLGPGGLVQATGAARGEPSLALPVVLIVRTDAPSQLAAQLATDGRVTGVTWDEVRAPRELVVSGPDRDATALAVLGAAKTSGASVHALSERVRGFRGGIAP